MWGYMNKRVCVRFSEKEFNEFNELLRSPRFPTYWGDRTWSKLIRWALAELKKQEAAAAVAAAVKTGTKEVSDTGSAVGQTSTRRKPRSSVAVRLPKKAKGV